VAEKYGIELTCIYENFDLSKPSLLIVPSLNIKDRQHTIYWDGKNIFDPATGIAYKEKPKNIAYIFQKYE
jgi:ABC-type molybdate transport system ATPase subunit